MCIYKRLMIVDRYVESCLWTWDPVLWTILTLAKDNAYKTGLSTWDIKCQVIPFLQLIDKSSDNRCEPMLERQLQWLEAELVLLNLLIVFMLWKNISGRFSTAHVWLLNVEHLKNDMVCSTNSQTHIKQNF